MIKVLVVWPDGNWEVRIISGEDNKDKQLRQLQTLVGGYIEGVYGRDLIWHAYLNEEGKLLGLPYNALATELCRALGRSGDDPLVGPVVFLSSTPGGVERSVPDFVLDALEFVRS